MKTKIREITIFAMLGAVFFVSKIAMEALPNIHLLAVLTIIYTIVYRVKAIIPITLGIILLGIFYGFASWWVPHLYIWPILWAFTLLIPKDAPKKITIPLYTILCALSGLTYGTLYSIYWSLVSSYTFEQTLMWISTGFYFDVIMCISNFCLSVLIYPISTLIIKLNNKLDINK